MENRLKRLQVNEIPALIGFEQSHVDGVGRLRRSQHGLPHKSMLHRYS
jgi:hypothetical protein